MRVASGRPGRVLVLRLEDGDEVHTCIEAAARDAQISHALCFLVGGADASSQLVVGPENGRAAAIVPMVTELGNVFETAAVGTLFPDEAGKPSLHMHAACGRGRETVAGCVRAGVDIWLIGEVVIWEILDCTAQRRRDPHTGFNLLEVD